MRATETRLLGSKHMPRRIAIVTDALYPFHMGGKELRSHHLVAGLAAGGYEIHVFTMNWWHGKRSRIEDGVTYHALCQRPSALQRQSPLFCRGRRLRARVPKARVLPVRPHRRRSEPPPSDPYDLARREAAPRSPRRYLS